MQTLKEVFAKQLKLDARASEPNISELLEYLSKLFQEQVSDQSKTPRFTALYERVRGSIEAGDLDKTVLDDMTLDKIKGW